MNLVINFFFKKMSSHLKSLYFGITWTTFRKLSYRD